MIPVQITISVGTRHIDRGQKLKIDSCPFALALNEQIGAYRPEVRLYSVMHFQHIWKDQEGRLITYSHPPEAIKFINDFDSGVNVYPAVFTLTRQEYNT